MSVLSLNAHALPPTPDSSPSNPPPTPLSPHGSASFTDSPTSRPNTANSNSNNNMNASSTPNTNVASANSTTAADAPATGNVKRKASRRANTAERRATHNAVERQRRETLNGRFLDLAALLPNLATVRRPSKSAIVNSSIALIHSQRRARAAAGRELRGIESDCDALRREVNEWRARSGAGLPALQPPARTAEFAALVSAEDFGAAAEEEERRAYALAGQEQDEGEEYDDGVGVEEAYAPRPPVPAPPYHQARRPSTSVEYARGAEYVTGAAGLSGREYVAGGVDLGVLNGHPRGLPMGMGVNGLMDAEKLAQWNAQLQFAMAQQGVMQQRNQEWALFTPPGTGHGPNVGGAGAEVGAGDMFNRFPRQFPTPFAYGLQVGTPPTTGSTDMEDPAGSGTESTHGSPGGSTHSDHVGVGVVSHSHGAHNHAGVANQAHTHVGIGNQGHNHNHNHVGPGPQQLPAGYGYAPTPTRRPSLSMAHSTGHVPQQWSAGGSQQFAAMGMLI